MEKFILNGRHYQINELLRHKLEKKLLSSFEFNTLLHIKNWLSGKDTFTFQTSGSTGEPKKLSFSREQIQKSAQRTIETFKLEKGQTVLCCLNTEFIAGFMMIIRAIVGDLELIIQKPTADPLVLIGDTNIDFVAMTPNQLDGSLPNNSGKLFQVRKILVGGAGLHPMLEGAIKDINAQVYHGYAMTETLTHVAIRNISKGQQHYRAVSGVTFGQNAKGCLVVQDDWLGIRRLVTNDIVQLINKKTFTWIGRKDNVVSSGGIKIQLETLEKSIAEIFSELQIDTSFCLAAIPDKSLSHRLILLVEEAGREVNPVQILNELKTRLPKYHDPKEVFLVRELLRTKTGKINRYKNTEVYLEHLNKKHD